MKFLIELKRRNVFRMAAAYLAASWLLIQLADTIFPLFLGLEGYVRLTVIILAIGFLPTLLLVWSFQLTNEGLKREEDVNHSIPKALQSRHRLNQVITILLALAVGYFIFERLVITPKREARVAEASRQTGAEEALAAADAARAELSIVILPFLDLSREGDQEYLAMGLTEELLNLLAQIPDLRVISRTSAFSFKDQKISAQDIAKKLNVSNVLEGSVRVDGDQLRVTTQLVNAVDDQHLWSQNWEGEIGDIFKIQDEIAKEVIDNLKIILMQDIPRAREANPEAFRLYLEAVDDRREFNEMSLQSAITKLKQAVKIDPGFARAWGSLGFRYFEQGLNEIHDMNESFNLAENAARKAMEINPDSREGLALSADMANATGQFFTAAAHLTHALEKFPYDPTLLGLGARFLTDLGRFEEADAVLQYLLERDPLSPEVFQALWHNSLFARDLEKAESYIRNCLFLSPDYLNGELYLAATLFAQGSYQEALQIAGQRPTGYFEALLLAALYQELGMTAEKDFVMGNLQNALGDEPDPIMWARVYGVLGDKEQAFTWLQKQYELRGSQYYWTNWVHWPWTWPLHDSPEWSPFLQQIGIAPAQLEAVEFEVGVPGLGS